MRKAVPIVAIVVLGFELCGVVTRARPTPPEAVRGVVVHDVKNGSPFSKAGIEREDIILAWRRLPSLPANPEEASGEIESAFDYMWLALEEAPRGDVELTIERDGELRLIWVAAGEWDPSHLPLMPDPRLESFLRGETRLEAAEADRLWMEVAEGAVDWPSVAG